MRKVIAKGVDLSYCQQNVDYGKIKAAGYKFAILKLGNARDKGLTIDELFDTHYKGAVAAGLDVGVYVYSLVTSPQAARECAKQAIASIKDKVITYPVFFDVEFEEFNLKCGRDVNTQLFKAFLSEIEANKYYAGVYTCPGFIDGYLSDNELRRYDHWIADCSPNKQLDYDGPCGLWQCSVAGDEQLDIMQIGGVPGVEGKCDIDYAFYDYPARIRNYGCNRLVDKPPKDAENVTVIGSIVKGEKVTVHNNATAYGGGKLADWVYKSVFTVLEKPINDRVVIGLDGNITAAVSESDLSIVTVGVDPSPAPTEKPKTLSRGDRVKVRLNATTYNGGGLAVYVYTNTYTVMETPTSDRVVIGDGKNITAAINAADLIRV